MRTNAVNLSGSKSGTATGSNDTPCHPGGANREKTIIGEPCSHAERNTPPPSIAARVRLHLTYLWRHHRRLHLHNPTTFTELVQHRKVADHDPRMPVLADKVEVKKFVRERLGPEWVIPTLWCGTDLPPQSSWPIPFVVKSRHGCRQNRFVLTGTENWKRIRREARRWMKKNYGFWLDEWLYELIPHGLLVEPFVGREGIPPIDYKFYVFDGRAAFIQVHLERSANHRWILFDSGWHRISSRTDDPDPFPPRSLAAMIRAAESLGEGFDFVRVDLYEPGDRPLFSEMTFYPGSGLDPLIPLSWTG